MRGRHTLLFRAHAFGRLRHRSRRQTVVCNGRFIVVVVIVQRLDQRRPLRRRLLRIDPGVEQVICGLKWTQLNIRHAIVVKLYTGTLAQYVDDSTTTEHALL